MASSLSLVLSYGVEGWRKELRGMECGVWRSKRV